MCALADKEIERRKRGCVCAGYTLAEKEEANVGRARRKRAAHMLAEKEEAAGLHTRRAEKKEREEGGLGVRWKPDIERKRACMWLC